MINLESLTIWLQLQTLYAHRHRGCGGFNGENVLGLLPWHEDKHAQTRFVSKGYALGTIESSWNWPKDLLRRFQRHQSVGVLLQQTKPSRTGCLSRCRVPKKSEASVPGVAREAQRRLSHEDSGTCSAPHCGTGSEGNKVEVVGVRCPRPGGGTA